MKTLLILLAMALCSCAQNTNGNSVLVDSIEDKYKIIDINPPKHFSVSVQNMRTGHIYYNIGRKKRCRGWRSGAKVQDVVYLTTYVYLDTINHVKWEYPSENDIKLLYCY